MSRPSAVQDLSSLPAGPSHPNAADDDIALARFELERRRGEREEQDLRLREKQLVLAQQNGRRMRGLPALVACAALSGLVFAGLLAGLLFQDHTHQRRELALAEAQVRLARQRMEADLVTLALAANTHEERAINLRFLSEAGFVTSATAARLAPLAQRAEGLPRFGRTALASPQDSSVQVVERRPVAVVPFPAPSPKPSSSSGAIVWPERTPAPAVAQPKQPVPVSPPSRSRSNLSQANSEAAAPENERGDRYARAQRTLQAHGYYSGPMDGRYDENTKKAVAKFQRERGLSDDGLIGPETLRAIRELARTGGSRQRSPGSNDR